MSRYIVKDIIILGGLVFVLIIINAIWYGIGGHTIKEVFYYLDKDNYITEEAVVEKILISKEEECVAFYLSGIDEVYQTDFFVIRNKSAYRLIDDGIAGKIKEGDKITYTSAPRYFGNGYSMPIVSLSVAGEELLSFEEGYRNLMFSYWYYLLWVIGLIVVWRYIRKPRKTINVEKRV